MSAIEAKPSAATPATAASEEPEGRDAGSDRAGKAEKKYGKGFVYMGLRECDEALRKIDHHEKVMSRVGFSRALGHPEPKGRFLHKLDALQKFSLLEVTGEEVRLTSLATDMLYGASEAARAKARATAFLAYPDFKRVFVECPKNEDQPREYVQEFVTAQLQIVTDVDRFIRLFIESAHFAGLLEGEPNPAASAFRLRPAPTPGAVTDAGLAAAQVGDGFINMPLEEVQAVLRSVGLDAYYGRGEVSQHSTGKFRLAAGEGKITVEIDRPIRICVKSQDLLADLPAILSALKENGFKA